jgi:hypothetical protein
MPIFIRFPNFFLIEGILNKTLEEKTSFSIIVFQLCRKHKSPREIKESVFRRIK